MSSAWCLFSVLAQCPFLSWLNVLGSMSVLCLGSMSLAQCPFSVLAQCLSTLGTVSQSHGLARPFLVAQDDLTFLSVLCSMSWGQLFLLLISTGPISSLHYVVGQWFFALPHAFFALCHRLTSHLVSLHFVIHMKCMVGQYNDWPILFYLSTLLFLSTSLVAGESYKLWSPLSHALHLFPLGAWCEQLAITHVLGQISLGILGHRLFSLSFNFDFNGWVLKQNVMVPKNDQHRFAFMGGVAWDLGALASLGYSGCPCGWPDVTPFLLPASTLPCHLCCNPSVADIRLAGFTHVPSAVIFILSGLKLM